MRLVAQVLSLYGVEPSRIPRLDSTLQAYPRGQAAFSFVASFQQPEAGAVSFVSDGHPSKVTLRQWFVLCAGNLCTEATVAALASICASLSYNPLLAS